MNIKKNNEILITNLSTDGILRLTLNNPTNQNTLSEELMKNIKQSIDDSAKNKKVRVLIISAVGPVFSAGHDLKELRKGRLDKDKGKKYFQRILNQCSQMMQSIIKNPKPIIAEVGGVATAAGCQLVASCDLAYASKSSKFATPGVNIGLFCSTPMVALSRNISKKHSMEMLLSGKLISSKKAAEIGLVNEVVEDNLLQKHTLEKALMITKKSSITLKIGKEAFYKQAEMSLSKAYEYTSNVMVENMLMDDAEEGIDAFIEKRTPRWRDK